VNERPATRDDLAAIAVDGWLHTIAFETNTWLLEEDGELVAGAFAQAFGPRGNSAGAVRPSAWGRGLGGRLVERIESRLADQGVERIHSWTVAGDSAADAL
jgi:GNAT superfamily N-acetyltransferase